MAVPYSIELLNDDPVDIKDFPAPGNSRTKLQKFTNDADAQPSPLPLLSTPKALSKPVEIDTEISRNSLIEAGKNNLKLTPLEQQVVELKKENPELLLIIECGYKYRIFGEDAETAGQILNMTVYPDRNFASFSFPVHRLLIHVKKLVENGCKVGVVDQKETAALKVAKSKTPFKRELTAVYTKATFIDESDDSGVTKMLNIPLCIVFICEGYAKNDGTCQIGIISCFTEDSDVVYDHFEDGASRSGLDARLTHWQPSEIVMPEKGVSTQTVNFSRQFSSYKTTSGDFIRIEFAELVDWASSLSLLSEVYAGDEEMMKELQELPPVVVCCLYMAYRHFQQYKMEQLITDLRYFLLTR